MRHLFCFLFLLLSSCSPQAQQKAEIKLVLIASHLNSPVALEAPKDGSNRLFICEQTGKIKIIKKGKVSGTPFLDISNKLSRLNKNYSEKGLLGLAFHPAYKSNGRFFIYFSGPSNASGSDHKSIIAEYKVSSNPDVADASSYKVIMEIEQPESNHNGGQLAFGPDGFLYIGIGDGGGAGDRHGKIGNGQNLNTHLGKILRIDVDSKSPYAIPKDNPFVNKPNIKPEIWAYGLRNPWRFSFDRQTGKLYCADVGQDKWEEINIIEKGKNYGWRIMEGNHCYEPSTGCDQKGLTLPVAEYDHRPLISITGGYVYRGKNVPSLNGKYIFADWSGPVFYINTTAGRQEIVNLNIQGKPGNETDTDINSFGEDERGEVYILTQESTGTDETNGAVYLIMKADK